MKKLAIALFILNFVVAASGQASAGDPPGASFTRTHRLKRHAPLPAFKKGELYSVLRERLANSGWRPASNVEADQCLKGDGRCEGRPEMQECAGTGEANCNFRWRKANIVIDVNTIADTPVVTAISQCSYHCR